MEPIGAPTGLTYILECRTAKGWAVIRELRADEADDETYAAMARQFMAEPTHFGIRLTVEPTVIAECNGCRTYAGVPFEAHHSTDCPLR